MSTQYTPTISTDENGDEYVDYEHGQLTQRNQFHHGMAPQGFEIDELTGEHSVFEADVDEQQQDLMSDYMRTMQEANPDLSAAIAYGNANLSPELMAGLYSSIEDGNLDEMHEYLEIVLAEFDDAVVATPEEKAETQAELEAEEEEEYEVPDLGDLYTQEPDYELQFDHMDNADATDNEVHKLLWSLSASFHANQLTQDEAIEQAMKSGFSRSDLIKAFNEITTSN